MEAVNLRPQWWRNMITSAQIRAARGLLQMSQQDLAAAAGVHVATIARLEKMPGRLKGMIETVESVEAALRSKGIQFVEGGVVYEGGRKLE